ncbi:MAG: DUF523 domain-containing protein [Deltaproteobacteria bacterium]|nr:DUF523 domain-containing protein [Deltaproteobacteria bacterium]
MQRILMSGCLAGLRVRYDGDTRRHPSLSLLAENAIIIPVCPEILGGLGIPRPRCRFVGGDGERVIAGQAQVIDENGVDKTEYLLRGAQATLQILRLGSPDLIIFKEVSPSCGLRRVDIEGKKAPGMGVTTALLRNSGIPILTEEDPLP